MSGVTEIYSCTRGQDIKEGKLDYSHDVTTRDDAESDAERRCKVNKKLAKIVYYSVSEDGAFRNFYTHTNKDAVGGSVKKPTATKARKSGKRRPKKVKKSLLAKVISSLTGR